MPKQDVLPDWTLSVGSLIFHSTAGKKFLWLKSFILLFVTSSQRIFIVLAPAMLWA